MANNQDVYFKNGKLEVVRNIPSATNSFAFKDADDTAFDYRNRLGLCESDAGYFKDMRALLQLFDKGNTLNTATETYLTGVGNGSITATISGRQLKAIDEFWDDLSGISTNIYLSMPFIGAGSAARIVEIGSAATTAEIGEVSFGDYGLVCVGSGAVTTGTTPATLDTGIGGMGVYIYATDSNVNACLMGANGSNQGRFEVSYGSASNTLTAYWGGSATSVVGSTLTAAPANTFIYFNRNAYNELNLYVNGTQVGSATGSVAVTNGSINIYVGALLNETSAANPFTGKIGCAVLTKGSVTAANAATLNTAISNFMLKLGRK